MGRLDIRVIGSGQPLLLVHGGSGREESWHAQEPLAERWRVMLPARRGFPPSPTAERQDFEADAEDIGAILDEEPAHCVGFSYGGVGLALAAAADPSRLLSLTLVEPALLGLAADRPAVRELMATFAQAGGDDPDAQRRAQAAFEDLARIEIPDEDLRRAFLEARDRAPIPRPPGEARPGLETIAAAGPPCLVVSGDHHPAHEAVCDVLAERLSAERAHLPGAAHAVPHAPGFNDVLERFLTSASGGSRT